MNNKIHLRNKQTGQPLEVSKTAYQMRQRKYQETHTIVQPAPAAKIAVEPTHEAGETAEVNASEEEHAAPKERQKPGPKPKNKEA